MIRHIPVRMAAFRPVITGGNNGLMFINSLTSRIDSLVILLKILIRGPFFLSLKTNWPYAFRPSDSGISNTSPIFVIIIFLCGTNIRFRLPRTLFSAPEGVEARLRVLRLRLFYGTVVPIRSYLTISVWKVEWGDFSLFISSLFFILCALRALRVFVVKS